MDKQVEDLTILDRTSVHSSKEQILSLFERHTRGAYGLIPSLVHFTINALLLTSEDAVLEGFLSSLLQLSGTYERSYENYLDAQLDAFEVNKLAQRKAEEGANVYASIELQANRVFGSRNPHFLSQLFPEDAVYQLSMSTGEIQIFWKEFLMRLSIFEEMAPAYLEAGRYQKDLDIFLQRRSRADDLLRFTEKSLEQLRVLLCEEMESLLGYLKWRHGKDTEAVSRFIDFERLLQIEPIHSE